MIYRARYVLPMDGRLIESGEVLIRNGIIIEVGQGAAVLYPDEEVNDLGNAVLMPGFVNVHSHIEPTMRRNFLDASNLWEWLDELGFRRDSAPSYELLKASAMLGAAECARSGMTCLGECSFSGAAAYAIDTTGLRAVVYKEVFGQSMGAEYPTKYAKAMDQVRELDESTSDRIRVGISPHSIYTSSEPVLRLCAESDLPVSLHLAETEAETEYTLRGTGPIADMRRGMGYEPMISGRTPAKYLNDIGLLRSGVCLAHCVCVSEDEVEMIAASGASVAHCPRSNAYLGSGVAPVTALRAAGAVVGLGTDSAASCMSLDMFEEMRFALGLHRAQAKDAGVMTAKDVLGMATVGGARALGLDNLVGTIEPGKRADMIAVDLSEMLPSEDIYLAIVSRSAKDVRLVLVDGHPAKTDVEFCRAQLIEQMEQLDIG